MKLGRDRDSATSVTQQHGIYVCVCSSLGVGVGDWVFFPEWHKAAGSKYTEASA